jgi:predicted O-linked N-acetylglucosamine transferase (SPINDLY family)
VAFAVADLLERHDRDAVEVVGYSYGPADESPVRRRLEEAVDRFVDLRDLTHEAAARRIRQDGVDILVDLTGYTRECRFPILAWRPAPIQVNFLGYAGTLGAACIDYILADPFVAPADHQGFYAERLVHLPGSFLPLDSRQAVAAAGPDRAGQGLPAEGVVFCCFNAAYKIAPPVFDAWMRLLHAVQGSVLWLSTPDERVRANLRHQAGQRGIAPERLVFAGRVAALEDHLARHRLADLFLDTLPYNAHSTAADALRSGLPVLTCAGETFAARVAGSLLTALDLPELITGSLDEYAARAVELARSPDRLAGLRGRLDDNLPRLLDGARYARGVEAAYRHMRDLALSGEAPQAFAVEPSGEGFATRRL